MTECATFRSHPNEQSEKTATMQVNPRVDSITTVAGVRTRGKSMVIIFRQARLDTRNAGGDIVVSQGHSSPLSGILSRCHERELVDYRRGCLLVLCQALRG